MANFGSIGEAFVKLKIDMRPFHKATNALQSQVKYLGSFMTKTLNTAASALSLSFSGVMKGIAASITAATASIVVFGTAIVATATSLGALATKELADFEQRMANVHSVVQDSYDSLSKLAKMAKTLGQQFAFAATDAADALYYLGCLKPDGIVLTEDGAKEIQNVKKGDNVVGFNGKLTKVVSKLMIRHCDENKIVKIKPACNLAFEVTPNHPIYAIRTQRCHRSKTSWCKPNCARKCTNKLYENYSKAEWIPAGKLSQGDAVAIPKNKNEKTIKLDFEYDRYYKQYEKLPKILNKDFAKFLGIILGDGWANGDGERIGVAFNDKDNENKVWYKSYLNSLGYSCSTFHNPGCAQLVTWSRPLNKFITKHMGRGAINKRIPQFMFDAKKDIICAFLNGYYISDGSLHKNQGKKKLSYTTISPNIAYGINYLVAKLGHYFNISEFMPKKDIRPRWKNYNLHKQYSIATNNPKLIELITNEKQNYTLRFKKTWQDDNFIYFPIKHINTKYYDGDVYNFETEDNTYSTGVIVHNSAGLNTQEIINTFPSTLKLARATLSDLSMATETVVNNINAFRLATTDADRVVNVLAATISGSQATLDKLRTSLGYAAPIAAALDIEIEELASAFGLLYNRGLEASMAGTGIRMSLTRLASPTRQAKKVMEELGITFEQIDPAKHNLAEIVGVLENAGVGLREISKMVGVRAGSTMLNLINAGSDAIREFRKEITDTNAVARMSRIQLDTLAGSFKKLWSQVKNVFIELGEDIGPYVKNIVDWFEKALHKLEEFSEEGDDSLRPVFEFIGEQVKNMSGFIEMMTEWAIELGRILAKAGTTITAVITNFMSIIAKFQPQIEKIANSIFDIVWDTLKRIGSYINQLIRHIADAIPKALKGLTKVTDALGLTTVQKEREFIKVYERVLERKKRLTKELIEVQEEKGASKADITWAKENLAFAEENLEILAQSYREEIGGDITKAIMPEFVFEDTYEKGKETWEKIGKVWEDLVSDVKDGTKDINSAIDEWTDYAKKKADGLAKEIDKGVDYVLNTQRQKIKKMWTDALTREIPKDVENVWQKILDSAKLPWKQRPAGWKIEQAEMRTRVSGLQEADTPEAQEKIKKMTEDIRKAEVGRIKAKEKQPEVQKKIVDLYKETEKAYGKKWDAYFRWEDLYLEEGKEEEIAKAKKAFDKATKAWHEAEDKLIKKEEKLIKLKHKEANLEAFITQTRKDLADFEEKHGVFAFGMSPEQRKKETARLEEMLKKHTALQMEFGIGRQQRIKESREAYQQTQKQKQYDVLEERRKKIQARYEEAMGASRYTYALRIQKELEKVEKQQEALGLKKKKDEDKPPEKDEAYWLKKIHAQLEEGLVVGMGE